MTSATLSREKQAIIRKTNVKRALQMTWLDKKTHSKAQISESAKRISVMK